LGFGHIASRLTRAKLNIESVGKVETGTAMTKLLDKAIDKIRTLPAQDQDALANALLTLAGEDVGVVELDDDTRQAVQEGLAEAQKGEFVADDIVTKADKRRGV
jgi:predicted transcriptional regulator